MMKNVSVSIDLIDQCNKTVNDFQKSMECQTSKLKAVVARMQEHIEYITKNVSAPNDQYNKTLSDFQKAVKCQTSNIIDEVARTQAKIEAIINR